MNASEDADVRGSDWRHGPLAKIVALRILALSARAWRRSRHECAADRLRGVLRSGGSREQDPPYELANPASEPRAPVPTPRTSSAASGANRAASGS